MVKPARDQDRGIAMLHRARATKPDRRPPARRPVHRQLRTATAVSANAHRCAAPRPNLELEVTDVPHERARVRAACSGKPRLWDHRTRQARFARAPGKPGPLVVRSRNHSRAPELPAVVAWRERSADRPRPVSATRPPLPHARLLRCVARPAFRAQSHTGVATGYARRQPTARTPTHR